MAAKGWISVYDVSHTIVYSNAKENNQLKTNSKPGENELKNVE